MAAARRSLAWCSTDLAKHRSGSMSDPDQQPCALCLQNAELRDSHIIPEFLYQAVYDEKHRFLVVSSDPTEQPDLEQKGLRERLLGDCCEARLSRWEDYAKRVLSGEGVVFAKGTDFLTVTGVNYAKFKLFQLSLLWRAGISSRPVFAAVALGPHGESLRRMLLAETPGQTNDYGCTIVFPPEPAAQELFRHAISAPTVGRFRAHHVYRFLLGMLGWTFTVSKHMRELPSDHFSLGEDGVLRLFNGGPAMMNYLSGLTGEIVGANQARGVASSEGRRANRSLSPAAGARRRRSR